jgi:hypothetical protein
LSERYTFAFRRLAPRLRDGTGNRRVRRKRRSGTIRGMLFKRTGFYTLLICTGRSVCFLKLFHGFVVLHLAVPKRGSFEFFTSPGAV